jgi:hypothetical protein
MGKAGMEYRSSCKKANGYIWSKIINKPDIHWPGKFSSTSKI